MDHFILDASYLLNNTALSPNPNLFPFELTEFMMINKDQLDSGSTNKHHQEKN